MRLDAGRPWGLQHTEQACSTSGRSQPGLIGSRAPLVVLARNRRIKKAAAGLKPADRSVPPPRLEYVGRMRQWEEDPSACPPLFLAPMENLADRPYRVALSDTVGGMDECCTEFMRVPGRVQAVDPAPSVRGVCLSYDAWELQSTGTSLGAQIMGSDPHFLSIATEYLAGPEKRAPRVDLNCGCPANTVTGNGAGSSLLRTPDLLHDCVAAMVKASGGQAPVSVKMRAGYDDASLFKANLEAVQSAGAAFVSIHPRTKRQTYEGRADWGLIRLARETLRIPVVGNGDVVSVAAAQQLLRESGCHAVMIGRGAIQDPLLFHRIKAHFAAAALTGRDPLDPLFTSQGAGGGGLLAGGEKGGRAAHGGWPWDEPEVVQALIRTYAEAAWGHLPDMTDADDSDAEVGPAGAGSSFASAGSSDGGEAGCSSGSDGPAGGMGRSHSRHKLTQRGKFGMVKKVMKYMLMSSPALAAECEGLLRLVPGGPDRLHVDDFVDICCNALKKHWPAQGPTRLVLVNHMGKGVQVLRGGEVRAAAAWEAEGTATGQEARREEAQVAA